MSANEAAYLGVQSPASIIPAHDTKKSHQQTALEDKLMTLKPAADVLLAIINDEIKKEDSNTYIRDRVRKVVANPTDRDYAIEQRASEIVTEKLKKIAALLETSKRKKVSNGK